MALSRDFNQTVAERVQRDPAFARALLDEAATLFLNGEPNTARLILRDLVNATIGFEALAAETAKPAKSLHRMLSKKGNPTMDDLASILAVVRKRLGVGLQLSGNAHEAVRANLGFRIATAHDPTYLALDTSMRNGFASNADIAKKLTSRSRIECGQGPCESRSPYLVVPTRCYAATAEGDQP